MIEKTILDRVPKYPGRVTLTPVAGMENTFDMARADGPIVEGTPIDKATLDSIIKSRLTGRYYTPTVAREVLASSGSTTSPVPSSGWQNSTATGATNGAYTIAASGSSANSNFPLNAFDQSISTSWQHETDSGETWISVHVTSRILVKKMRVYWFSYDTSSLNVKIQGSNNGTAWVNIAEYVGSLDAPIELTIANPVEYSYYRLLFTQGTENAMRLYTWEFSDWTVSTYKNAFTVAEGLPTEWTEGQRVMIQTPVVNTVGILSNTLNGVEVKTILQSNKLYELTYRNGAFVTKEV